MISRKIAAPMAAKAWRNLSKIKFHPRKLYIISPHFLSIAHLSLIIAINFLE